MFVCVCALVVCVYACVRLVSDEVGNREQGYLKVHVYVCLCVCVHLLCVYVCVRLVSDEVWKRKLGYFKVRVFVCVCVCVHSLCVCVCVCKWSQMRPGNVNRVI